MTEIREAFPYLHVRGGAAAIDFYTRVFGARLVERVDWGDKIGHAELQLGPVMIMLADEFPDLGIRSPLAYGGTGTTMHLHVDDVDALGRRAVEAGATMVLEPTDQAHGERQCRVRDPFGHEWLLGQEIQPK